MWFRNQICSQTYWFLFCCLRQRHRCAPLLGHMAIWWFLFVNGQIWIQFAIIILLLFYQFLKIIDDIPDQFEILDIFPLLFLNNSTIQIFKTITPILKLIHFVQSTDVPQFWCRFHRSSGCRRPLRYLGIDFEYADFLLFRIGARSRCWTHSHQIILRTEFGHTILPRHITWLELVFDCVHIFAVTHVFTFVHAIVIFQIILFQKLLI